MKTNLYNTTKYYEWFRPLRHSISSQDWALLRMAELSPPGDINLDDATSEYVRACLYAIKQDKLTKPIRNPKSNI